MRRETRCAARHAPHRMAQAHQPSRPCLPPLRHAERTPRRTDTPRRTPPRPSHPPDATPLPLGSECERGQPAAIRAAATGPPRCAPDGLLPRRAMPWAALALHARAAGTGGGCAGHGPGLGRGGPGQGRGGTAGIALRRCGCALRPARRYAAATPMHTRPRLDRSRPAAPARTCSAATPRDARGAGARRDGRVGRREAGACATKPAAPTRQGRCAIVRPVRDRAPI